MEWLKSKTSVGGKPGDKRARRKKTQFSLWYFVAAFLILSFINTQLLREEITHLPYSEFKTLVAAGRVVTAEIEREHIKGTFKEGDKTKKFRTVRVEDPKLVELLGAKNVEYTGQAENALLTNLLSWVIPPLIILAIWIVILRRMGPGGAGVMSFGRSRAKIYAEDETKVSFDDVAGVDEPQEELEEIIEFLKHPEKFRHLGATIPKGVLLVGPPGTGKTLLARAVAGKAEVPFFSISGSEFVEMFVGVGAARVRDLFSQASERAPCIIFIDELDAIGKARGANPLGGHDEREQTLNQLLVEMDGFEPRMGVIIMSATNRPEILDPALLRPGRFDRQVVVDRPDLLGREAILGVHVKKIKLSPDVDLNVVARRTPGFVGADLANIVNEAALLAARRGKQVVEMEEMDEAIDRAILGLEKKSRVISPRVKEIVAYHESGHALVAESVEHADPVHKISIVPRGVSALGYTVHTASEDNVMGFATKAELLDQMAALLGGRVAEEIVFSDVSTGAQNDLHRVTDIARDMVKEYGMSDRLGPISYEKERRPLFIGGPGVSGGREYSEETAQAIDEEVKKIVEGTYERVRTILQDQRNMLDQLAKLLLEKEVVEGDELRDLIKAEEI
ncbi:MAG: ATP-dependent zinc metalloprotease FtsH [Nitrospinae bacterium]|nr:ATP-dependent zinc metalloprotease FtsH [Nitrospinota bacterium]